VQQEPFALRALKKEGKIYCVKCESELGLLNICKGCGALLPGYHIVQATKPARRKLHKPSYSFGFATKAEVGPLAGRTAESASAKPLLLKVGILAVMVLLVIAAGTYYHNQKTEREYARNFVLSLYGITYGVDLGLKNSSAIAAEWKIKAETGQYFSPRIRPEQEAALGKVKAELDTVMQKLGETPEKFRSVNERLIGLRAVYARTHALNIAPPDTLAKYEESLGKLEGEYSRSAHELMASLPAPLLEEVRSAAPRYKSLQPLLAN
jgi:hypothetical protein